MAKIYGLFGSMTGKLADTVMSVRNGEQIARKYQPVVFNPSTPAQVATRAKLKLMSQMSAVMAPVIAIPRQGSVSSRNLFTKKNFWAATYSTDTASIDLLAVQLTNSVVSLPPLTVERSADTISVKLTGTRGSDLNRVVYAVFEKQSDNTLRYLTSQVISTPGSDFGFEATIQLDAAGVNAVVYAYGVRDNSDAARIAFGNLEVPSAQDVAKLIVTRVLTESDVTLTETQAIVSAAAAVNPDVEPTPNPDTRSSKKK